MRWPREDPQLGSTGCRMKSFRARVRSLRFVGTVIPKRETTLARASSDMEQMADSRRSLRLSSTSGNPACALIASFTVASVSSFPSSVPADDLPDRISLWRASSVSLSFFFISDTLRLISGISPMVLGGWMALVAAMGTLGTLGAGPAAAGLEALVSTSISSISSISSAPVSMFSIPITTAASSVVRRRLTSLVTTSTPPSIDEAG
mmetsp:Transcript_12488/g.35609  ORF Transcript_12488/g.35609 Transcript_12488/m.35609 type:complete len:206 (-) Transcript_12488:2104-2721(-)